MYIYTLVGFGFGLHFRRLTYPTGTARAPRQLAGSQPFQTRIQAILTRSNRIGRLPLTDARTPSQLNVGKRFRTFGPILDPVLASNQCLPVHQSRNRVPAGPLSA